MPTNFSTQQLIDDFHESLRGDSIVERKKSFRGYLNSLKTNTNGDLQELVAVVDGIIPQDFWESVLKVDIILHYELFPQSLEILKSENKVLVSKVVKNAWFAKKLLETYTPQQFVDELFCVTSVSSRTKIINRLIKYNKDEVFGKELFEAYTEKYGLRAAKQLLPLCPLNVVEEVVINKKIKPSTSTIRKLIRKDLELVKFFFKNAGYQNNDEIKCIARTNLPFFIEFLRETYINFGNSTTHKLIATSKSYIIDPKYLNSGIFNLKRVHFDLKNEYEQLVFKLIVAKGEPASFESFSAILSPMPKQKQRAIYLGAFKEVAKCCLEEKPDLIDESFLQACEDVDERDKYAELAYNVEKETSWIKYMRIEKSVPLLKEKVSFASKPREREPLISALVKTCHINDDKSALLDVLKYITKRFRNDREDVRACFCRALLRHFKLHELCKEHWKYINELQKLFEVNNEHFYEDRDIIHEQIIFSLKNREPIEEFIAKLYEKAYSVNYNYNRSDAGIEKEFILQGVAHWNGETEDDNDTKFKGYLPLLESIQSYNSRHKDDIIDIRQTLPIKWMIERLEKGIEQWFSCIKSLLTYCIFGDAEPEEQDKAIHVLFKYSRQDNNILLHFIRNVPNVFMNHIDVFLKSGAVLEIFESKTLLKYYKRLSHLNLNQRVLEYLKTSLSKEGDIDEDKQDIIRRKTECLKALAVCMEEESYLNLIKQYRPDKAHLVLDSDELAELYEYRQAICENLVKLNTPSKALDALLPFCLGDYLKFCMRSLHHFVHHTQERNIPHVIDELKTKAVSVRKHAAFLSLATLERSYNLQFIESFIDKEQNHSVITHVLKSISKYFTKNLDKDFFEMFKLLLNKVEKNDENTLNFITKECALPEIFVAEYVEFVWNTIEAFGRQGSDYEHTKFALLGHLKERDYILLHDEFLNKIIKQIFLKEIKLVSSNIITDVTIRYLVYCNSTEKQNFRLQLVFGMLRDLKETDTNKALYSGAAFVEKFCKFAVKHRSPSIELLTRFKEHFSTFTDVIESFNVHLDLDLLELHIKSESSENYVVCFSEKVANFLKDFEQKYGICLLMYSKHKIERFIDLRLDKLGYHLYRENRYIFLEHLYATYDGLAAAILVVDLLLRLDDNDFYDPQTVQRYESLITKLKNREEPVVKVFLMSHLRG